MPKANRYKDDDLDEKTNKEKNKMYQDKKVNIELSLKEIRAIAFILYFYEKIGIELKDFLRIYLEINSDLLENKKDYQEFLKGDFLENIQDKLMVAKQGEK
jgi:hypothetical protein